MAAAPRGFDPITLARKLWARRVALLGFHLAVAAVATGVVLVLPRWYESTATLVPAAREGLPLEVPQGMLPRASLRLGDGPTAQDQLALVLASGAVADSLVTRFDLARRWNVASRGQARRLLVAHRRVSTPSRGEVVIAVEAREAALARDLAAGFVDLAAVETQRLRRALQPAVGAEAPAFAVLDAATLPDVPARPHRAMTVVLALALAAAGSLVGLHFDDEERRSWLPWQPKLVRGGRGADRKAA